MDGGFHLLVCAQFRLLGVFPLQRVPEPCSGGLAVPFRCKPIADCHLVLLSEPNIFFMNVRFGGLSAVAFCLSPRNSRLAIRRKLFVTSLSGAISQSSFPRLSEEMTVGESFGTGKDTGRFLISSILSSSISSRGLCALRGSRAVPG